MSLSKVNQSTLISAFVFVVGQIVAFAPSMATDEQNLISAGSAAIAAAFAIGRAIHALAESNTSARDVKNDAIAAARSELARVNVDQLAVDAVHAAVQGTSAADLEAKAAAAAREEIGKLLGTGLAQATPQSLATPAQTASPNPSADPQAVPGSAHLGTTS